jgi:hypothetical protein
LALLTVTPTGILDRIVLSELFLDVFAFSDVDEVARTVGRSGRPGVPIPGPTEFAISLKTYVDKVTGASPPCGHVDVKKEFGKEESD